MSVNSTCLDYGPSLPEGAVHKSPRIRVGTEFHGTQCSGSCGKGNWEFLMAGISGAWSLTIGSKRDSLRKERAMEQRSSLRRLRSE
jgi:hypothetical protein